MHYPKYTEITASPDFDVFEFISIGIKGEIIKKIQFAETYYPGIYNLGFGDKINEADIDDETDSNNGDRDKVLATVADVVYFYTSIYPDRNIIFFGSNDVRTRLYRMAISNNFELLNKDFHIFAVQLVNGRIIRIPFSHNINCIGFLIKRK